MVYKRLITGISTACVALCCTGQVLADTYTVELESLNSQSLFSPFSVVSDNSASSGQYVVWPDSSDQMLSSASDNQSGTLAVAFTLSENTDVQFALRANLPNAADDSFYYKMDSGSWQTQNNTQTSGWQTLTVNSFSSLAAGDHTLYLLRREDGAQLDSVTLTSSNGAFGSVSLTLELESFSSQSLFSPLSVSTDSSASGGQYIVWPNNGNQSLSSASDSASGQVAIAFSASETSDVSVKVKANLPNAADDSFYYKFDSGSWATQNNTQTSGWETLDLTTLTNVTAGKHTLYLLRREDGAKLDNVTLTTNVGVLSAEVPDDNGNGNTGEYQAPSDAIHVSKSGSDNGSGNASSPFLTIAKAAQSASAGDTVLVHGGTYSESGIQPASSGSSGNYIVFRPMPGTGDVIIKHPASSANTTPVFNLSSRSYIWIEGFEFSDFTQGLASIYVNNGDNNVIVNNEFKNLGNSAVASWNGNQVVGLFNSTNNVVCNNNFSNIYGDGVNVNSQSSEYNLVCHNTFTGFKGKLRSWGGSYTYSRAVDVQDMSDGNNVVAFNHAENVVHHVWLDRDGSNNVILRNYGKTGSGNVFNESRCKHNVIQENISVDMNVGYMSAYYTSTGWTEDARWVSNVAYDNTTGFNIHKSMRDEFRNNISYNNDTYNLRFSDAARNNGPHTFANNLWYTENKSQSIYFGGIPQATEAGGSTYSGTDTTVASFQSQMSESNGLSANPQFNGSNNFTLQSSSPAKQAGDNGLDLGAYAYYPKTDTGWDSSAASSNVSVSFDTALTEVNRGSTANLTIKLNQVSSSTVTVQISPVAGDAIPSEDFNLNSSQVTFTPGETTKTISVSTTGNFAHDELVALTLRSATNASVSAKQLHVLKILAQ